MIPALHASPVEALWNYGPLPPVESVKYDCLIMVWSPEYVGLIAPWGDENNPLRWNDSIHWHEKEPVGWWTVLREGTKDRPANVQTWAEHDAEQAAKYPPGSLTEWLLAEFEGASDDNLKLRLKVDALVPHLLVQALREDGSLDPDKFPTSVDVADPRVVSLANRLKELLGRKE